MRLYSEYLLPRVYDWLMDRPFLRERRREQLTSASGNVLEIGIGTGLNLPHYPRSITEITAVEPNPGMNAMLQRRLRTVNLRVHLHPVSGEHLPFADESFDCVVSTLVLCSIPNVERAVAEVYRVLKPNGSYLFLEHGISPDAKVQRWQRRLNWLQRRAGDGCRLDLDVPRLLDATPFRECEIHAGYLAQAPATHGYIYGGQATK